MENLFKGIVLIFIGIFFGYKLLTSKGETTLFRALLFTIFMLIGIIGVVFLLIWTTYA